MVELIDGEHYWLRPTDQLATPERRFISTELFVGKYNKDGWTYPVFDLCGDDLIHKVSDFEIISHIERPHE